MGAQQHCNLEWAAKQQALAPNDPDVESPLGGFTNGEMIVATVRWDPLIAWETIQQEHVR
jgi:hypothetical protein